MIYKVTKQFETGSEQQCKQFNKVEDAQTFAQEGAQTDASMKIKVVYRVYEFDEVLDTIDSSKVEINQSSSNESESSGSSRGQGSTFSPTPLEMTPRPKGTAPHWIKDEDDEKDNGDQ